MTQNLYVGADVDAIIAALASGNPAEVQAALLAAVETLQKTDYSTRAAAIAREIDRTRPHVVGLQEVSTIDLDLSGLGVPFTYHVDFLPILLADLAARGLNYTVGAQVKNIEATPLPGISLVDYDAMLVDAQRVTVQSKTEQNFTHNLGVVGGVDLKRGWVTVTATINGESYTFASTHPESGASPGLPELRAAQITELVGALAEDSPVIVMGDLNDEPGSPMYQVLIGAGYADVWATLRPGAPGYTAIQPPDLLNPISHFTQRIDYIFARGMEQGHRDALGQIFRIGFLPFEKVAGPAGRIWPSDHAGLVAYLMLVPGHHKGP
jgi:endonuclease/exonuclease/phosphatase family metal-dependent hydrolase